MSIKIGDTIKDDSCLIRAKVLGEGTMRFGRKELPAWKVRILTGHQKGTVGLIFKEFAEEVCSIEAEQ